MFNKITQDVSSIQTIGTGPFSLKERALTYLPIDLIDEDPKQPRKQDSPGFTKSSLRELSATIEMRGVKSPISVRENPERVGRFLVNHGARRLRASKLAGLKVIPAFIDNDYSETDQVIENLQRNELTAREVADFIGREIARGKKRGEIARCIGKSGAFVTQHANLLDLPGPLAQVFHSGRSRDVTVINELLTAYKQHPNSVQLWLSDDTQELTRSSVKLLRQFLAEKNKKKGLSPGSQFHEGELDPQADSLFPSQLMPNSAGRPGQPLNSLCENTNNSVGESAAVYATQLVHTSGPKMNKLSKPRLLVRYQEEMAELMIYVQPSFENRGWIHLKGQGRVIEVDLESLELVALQTK